MGSVASVALIDDDAKVGAARAPEPLDQGEGDVGVQVPLVELVEDHDRDAVEVGRGDELATEHALGDEADARPGARDVLEAHLVAHGAADLLAELLGDASGGHARREASGLEHDDAAALGEARVEQGPRHARRLARARGRLEHERRVRAQRRDDLGQQRVDGQGEHRGERRGLNRKAGRREGEREVRTI